MASALRCFWGLSLSLSLYLIHSISTSHVYIVYLGHVHHTDPFLTSEHHVRLLASVFQRHSFSGFAATLNESQAAILTNARGVVSVFKSETLKLHTTRSWDFMGLTLSGGGMAMQQQQLSSDDVIVGVIDSGVWPESGSFMEEAGMGPVPLQWRGACIRGEEFEPKKHCNKKLIGAKYFRKGLEKVYPLLMLNKSENSEYISARDMDGHGTHTASIAVGSRVKNASLFGFGRGVARGGAPRARLAVYKACWYHGNDSTTCAEDDLLAAFDHALHDGVHVISTSIGKPPPLRSLLAASAGIGSFHAMQLGVTVVFSAGNAGPDLSTVENVYPWSIAVAASTVDRSFPAKILLDDGTTSFMGEEYRMSGKSAVGLILLCFSNDGSEKFSLDAEYAATQTNAMALILVQPITRPTVAALSTSIPLVRLDISQGTKLALLLNFGDKLSILPGETAFQRSPAPVVADFSSRGPSSISPHFLKVPDISAPGVNILAAWAPSKVYNPDRKWNWNFNSGTSMACPHVSGVVALLKSAYPHWSPAAIRSALITTAYNTDIFGDDISIEPSQKNANPFDIGSGHINPVKALDPGLIYDTTSRDYVNLLCNMGYSEEQIESMVICPLTTCTRCPRNPEPNWNINYPSISVPNLSCTTTIRRTVTNVGHFKTAVYYVTVANPHGVQVVVSPKILLFSPFKEEITYYVTLTPLKISRARYVFGSLTWSDGFHHVRTPLVVQVNTTVLLAADDDV
ncbi:hypothetical protein C2S53_004446 [Perilla frutescens var. hirtella]|uniref:Uncharacterized protein n=1 Tax=Perilla frutescens var. hirtella TaxID=608512 RepID=A0AAD4IYX2_PERFH|nr:hypothetical protein C2S53_004446 [Perilla frutescens var. hirtella]